MRFQVSLLVPFIAIAFAYGFHPRDTDAAYELGFENGQAVVRADEDSLDSSLLSRRIGADDDDLLALKPRDIVKCIVCGIQCVNPSYDIIANKENWRCGRCRSPTTSGRRGSRGCL